MQLKSPNGVSVEVKDAAQAATLMAIGYREVSKQAAAKPTTAKPAPRRTAKRAE